MLLSEAFQTAPIIQITVSGAQGTPGGTGYEGAVAAGYEGTEIEWLAFLNTVGETVVEGVADAEAAVAAAEIAAQAALLAGEIWETTAKALSNGVLGYTSLVGGSGGTNGTFALGFSGGGGTGAVGTFTVVGGAVTGINITWPGDSYTTAPALSFAASAGLTGASATAVIGPNNPVNALFWVVGAGDVAAQLYKNVAGVATAQSISFPSKAYVDSSLILARQASSESALIGATTLETQVIGSATPVTGSSLGATPTYLIDVPVSAKGFLNQIAVFGMTAGTLKIKRFTKSGTTYTFVSEITITIALGLNTIDVQALAAQMDFNPGDYIGIFQGTGRIAFTGVTAGSSTPYYSPTGDITTNFVAGARTTANLLQINFAIPINGHRDADEYQTRLAAIEGGGVTIEPQAIGTAVPVTGADLSVSPTYLINVPVSYDGYVSAITLWGKLGGIVKLKRFTKSGTTYTMAGEVSVPFAAGLNVLTAWEDFPGLNLQSGDYLGVFFQAGKAAVTVSVANSTPYYAPAGDITTNFVSGAQVTANRLEFGFTVAGAVPVPGSGAPDTSARPKHSERLRRFRAFKTKRERAESARYRLALVGDSWSTVSQYYLSYFAAKLIALYGDGGVGWFGFGYGSGAVPLGDARDLYAGVLTGTWTQNYHAGSTSPNISDIRSSVAASKITVSNVLNATHPALSAAKLHFTGTADGVIRWRWNGGAWSGNTNVQGGVGVQQALDLTGFPVGALASAAAGTITLEIEHVSGSIILGGVDLRSATDGIVFHKLGSSGSKASDWIASTAAQFEAGMALLGVDGAQLLFGTNEDAAGQTALQIATNYQDLAGRILTAVPSADLMLVVAPENGLVNGNDMTLYATAIAELTEGISPDVFAAFNDLQPAFGNPASMTEYLFGGAVAMLDVSNAHPSTTFGAPVVAQELALTWLGEQ